MKNTQRIAILLSAGLLLVAPSCGSATNNAGTSASVSVEEHEFTASDLTGIFELPTIYVAENATNVVLSGVLDYDDTIIKSITGGEVDATKLGMQDVTLTITVDKAALAEAIGLEGDFSGEADIEYTVSVNVILEDVIEDTLLTMVDSIILGSDNTVYELTEEATDTTGEVADAATSTDGSTEQSESGTTEATTTTTTSTPKVTTSGSSKVTTSSSKVSSTTSAANNKSNTTTTTTNSNKGNTSNTGSTSSNKSNTTTSTSTNTKKDTTTSTTTKTDTSSTKTDTSKKTETTTTTTPTHTHSWKAVYKTVHHDEVGHNETRTVTAAYDEPIYETRYVCGTCGATYGANESEAFFDHLDFQHDGSAYSSQDVQVGTKHHDAVTETVYVVDTAAYDEQVVDHYECSCGAAK